MLSLYSASTMGSGSGGHALLTPHVILAVMPSVTLHSLLIYYYCFLPHLAGIRSNPTKSFVPRTIMIGGKVTRALIA